VSAPELDGLRAAIEDLDATLVSLIAERMTLARAVGRVKAAAGQPVMDPMRESVVVARIAALSRDAGLPEDEMRALYWRLLALSRGVQVE